MHTNDLDRDHTIIRAMGDYQQQLATPERVLHIPTWIAANVSDASVHTELHEAIELSLALGPIERVTDLELTEHERMRQRWHAKVKEMERGAH